MEDLPQKAIRAVQRIVDDLKGRRELRQGWEEIDEDVQGEIMIEWVGIIVKDCGP